MCSQLGGLSGQTVSAVAAVMAAGFLITRILVLFLLSELDFSSAFPRARSSVYPEAGREKQQEGYGYGNRRPLQYIQALRQPRRKPQPNVHDQVQVRTWQKPKGSSLRVRSHAQRQNQPSLYHQSLYQPWSDVATKWKQEMSPPQPPPPRNQPLAKPRSFEFSLKIPFANVLGQNKGTNLTTKGSDLNSGGSTGAGPSFQLYRPSSVQVYTGFNSPSASDVFSDKGSTIYPNGGENAHDDSKPSFQISLSVPIHPTNPSPKFPSSSGGYLANPHRPGSVGFIQNGYMESAKPQSSSTHVSQHATSVEQISQGKIPTEQSQVFPKPQAPSLPIPQYRPLQSDSVHSGYYSAQINPASNEYGKGPSEQTFSPDPTNQHLFLSPSQYEQVPSGDYTAGQVKPSGNNCGQHQTWQQVGTQLDFASEQYNCGQFKPSFGHEQIVETEPNWSPEHPSSPTVAPSQYELPSFGYHNKEVATANYGTGSVVQMGQTDFPSASPFQYSRGQSGQDASPDHLTAFDQSSNFQVLSTDYQTQMRLPGQYTGRGQLDGKPKYTKLFIDVEDATDSADGQHNYFAAPSTHYDSYSGKWTENNMEVKPQSVASVSQDQLTLSMDSGLGQYASNPQQQKGQIQTSDPVLGQASYAPHVGANAGYVDAFRVKQTGRRKSEHRTEQV